MAISRKTNADSTGTNPSTNEPSEEMAHGGGDDTNDESSLIAELQEECDFLLCKLRIIEAICHASEKTKFIQDILNILYKSSTYSSEWHNAENKEN